MSLTRKTYDGNFPRGNNGTLERGDTVGVKSPAGRNASAKRTKRVARVSDLEDNFFAEENDKDRYLITYADLITLLLGLFIILYAISNIDLLKYEKMMSAIGNVFGGAQVINGQPSGKSIAVEPINELKDELNTLIKDLNYTKSITVEQNERGITLHILDDLLFASGSAELNTSSEDVLSQLAKIIKKLPNDLRVEGHTDNIPIKSSLFPSNWHLSVARALNTAYFLIDKENLNPDKVSIVGYSEYQPIASNITPIGRAKNRRVDLVIIK